MHVVGQYELSRRARKSLHLGVFVRMYVRRRLLPAAHGGGLHEQQRDDLRPALLPDARYPLRWQRGLLQRELRLVVVHV